MDILGVSAITSLVMMSRASIVLSLLQIDPRFLRPLDYHDHPDHRRRPSLPGYFVHLVRGTITQERTDAICQLRRGR